MPNDYEKFKPQNEMAENKETSSENKENKEISPEQAVEIVQQQVVEAINIGETALNTTMKKLEANPEETTNASTELSAINEEIAELGENVTEEIIEPQENSTEKYSIRPDESPEHYLRRISKPKKIDKLAKAHRLRSHFLNTLPKEDIEKIIQNILNQTNVEKKLNKENSIKNLEKIHLGFYSAGDFSNPDTERNEQSFSKTTQGRKFFYTGPEGADSFPYSESLFSLPINPKEHPSVKEYYKKLLDNKNILLLGGGNSIEDLLKDPDIKPNKVINIDPFLKYENFDKNPQENYYNLDKKADDPTLTEFFKEQNIKADEIWASYSVPLYLKTPEEISNLFNNIKNNLAEQGTCRIYPLATTFGENKTEMDKMMKSILKDMVDKEEFNVEKTGDLLMITRIKKE